MSLLQHIGKFFCFGYYVLNLFFHLLAFVLSYQFILSLFEAFQFYVRTSHPLKKVRLEKSGLLYLGSLEWTALALVNYTVQWRVAFSCYYSWKLHFTALNWNVWIWQDAIYEIHCMKQTENMKTWTAKSQLLYYHTTYYSWSYVVDSAHECFAETFSHSKISQHQASFKHENFTVCMISQHIEWGLVKKTTYHTSVKVTSLMTSQWCHGWMVTSHSNFCDDSITAKADNDITKSTGTTILQTSTSSSSTPYTPYRTQCCHSTLTSFPYEKNEKSLHFPTQSETTNAICNHL